jgi:hypothetical protein
MTCVPLGIEVSGECVVSGKFVGHISIKIEEIEAEKMTNPFALSPSDSTGGSQLVMEIDVRVLVDNEIPLCFVSPFSKRAISHTAQ